jgi:hypothetical protein
MLMRGLIETPSVDMRIILQPAGSSLRAGTPVHTAGVRLFGFQDADSMQVLAGTASPDRIPVSSKNTGDTHETIPPCFGVRRGRTDVVRARIRAG